MFGARSRGPVRLFGGRARALPRPGRGDLVVLLVVTAVVGVALSAAHEAAGHAREVVLDLSPARLPGYALLSLARMTAAYALSLGFSLAVGALAARSRAAERVLLPALDVLQSVPILSFLPVVLLTLTAVLPEGLAVELSAVALLFTSQVWHLTFAWYQALTTTPVELREAAASFRLGRWQRLRALELPHGAISLVWNSMMSWAGGWFFLMAAEAFSVGARDFRLPGLGSYLEAAAAQGDVRAIGLGVATLVALIVALDQLLWRPLIAWSDRFKLDTVAGAEAPSSWFLDAQRGSAAVAWLRGRLRAALDALGPGPAPAPAAAGRPRLARRTLGVVGGVALAGGLLQLTALVALVPPAGWRAVALGLLATLLRVAAALALALLWTVPAGVAIGSSPRLARVVQPLVQVAASVPATALFPIVLLVLLRLPRGLELAAVVLMLMGTQWYLLFNVIAGAAAIPQDLRHTASALRLGRVARWRALVLPAIFPHLVTGAVTAAGGAWNASIVAEYVRFGERTERTVGIGAVIADATARGDFPLLAGATVALVGAVALLNLLVWRRLYRVAEDRFRLE